MEGQSIPVTLVTASLKIVCILAASGYQNTDIETNQTDTRAPPSPPLSPSPPPTPSPPPFPSPSPPPPPRLISELETLVAILAADRNLLAPFYQELRDLRLWVRDTKEIMTIEDTSHIASGSSLVRGKRQVSECTTEEDKDFILACHVLVSM